MNNHHARICLHAALLLLVTFIGLPFSISSASDGEQRFADLGKLRLENGETLKNATIGYRTYGQEALPDGSNVIVWPMWFGGQSGEVAFFGLIGPGQLLDTDKHAIIVIDPPGNGISSSPDQTPGRFRFPTISIGDMVHSEYRLLTEILGITHVKAVIGYSMGGMQTFEWLVAYPDFLDKAVPIVGSPRSTGFEAVNLGGQISALEAADEPSRQLEGLKSASIQATRAYWGSDFFAAMSPGEAEDFAAADLEANIAKGFGAQNWALQARAALGQDISRQFGGDLSAAAAEVQAEVLVIVHERDGWNSPQSALQFANFVAADLIVLSGFCDHLSYFCGDSIIVNPAVSDFLEN